MNKSELKDLVKKYFNLTEIENPIENKEAEKFAVAHLIDDTEVTNDKDAEFAEGDSLFVVTAEGEKVQAPAGEHELKSGIVVTVSEEGIITGIKRPGEEGEGSLEASEEEMSKEEVVEEKFEEEIVEEIKSEDLIEAISELVMPEIESMKSEMANCMERLAKAEELMAKYEEKMSATPAAESKTTAKFSKQRKSIKNSQGPKYNTRRYEATLAQLSKR